VCLDDVRSKVLIQGLCQVELATAVRALALELRGRLGVWAPQAADQVLISIEDKLRQSLAEQ
ncbi:unnamed protein product, partial [Symbiodinium pilosum]